MMGKVASMTGICRVEIKEYEVPKAEMGQVIMQVQRSNICGSDVHMWEGKHIFKNHVLGHEMVGTVYELGEGVTTDYAGQPVKVGDRICPVYYTTCMKCEACLEGNFNICIHGSDAWGQPAEQYPHFTGGFATHYVIRSNQFFYKIPDEIPDNIAAGANCGISQMLYAMEQAGVKPNDFVVVQGIGGLGLYTSAICDVMGANVIAMDMVEERLQAAKSFGARHIIDMKKFTTKEERHQEILRITEKKGADIVVDVSGNPDAFGEALQIAKLGGTIIEIGNVSIEKAESASVIPGMIVRKCLTIKGVLRYPPIYLYRTLKFLMKYHEKYPFADLTDKCYSLEETQAALQKAANKEVKRAIIAPNL